MPNTPRTQHRSVRVDDDLWTNAGEAAERAGTDRGAVIRQFLRWFVREPGAELPERPDQHSSSEETSSFVS